MTVSSLPMGFGADAALGLAGEWLAELNGAASQGLAVAASLTTASVKQAIDQVPLGARVPGLNPLRWEYDSTFAEPDASSWAKLTLLMRKRDGGVVDAEVLRPRAWIEAAGIAVGKPLPLNLPELDIREQVEVTAIEACPAIAEGAGSVVTARFVTREAHLVASVQLRGPRGELETLTGTQQHPIWSVDRRDWVPLSELREGERLLCSHLSPPWGRGTDEGANHAIVLRVTLSTVCEPVYNLEIHGEHVYQVGELGVLVHNGTPGIDGCPLGSAGAPNSKFRGGKHGNTKFPRGDGLDSNHSPADAISPFRSDDGPAFQMEPRDHRRMSSTGSSRLAKAWRQKQQDLIAEGKLREAVQMDIDEAKTLYGNKYDDAIQEMLDYITSIGY